MDDPTDVDETAFQYDGTGDVDKGVVHVIVEEGVTVIPDDAFNECDRMTTIEIPSSVMSIGNRAFFGCNSMTTIILPSSLTSIGYSAFARCSSITTIVLPSSVTSIGNDAFYRCSSITTIILPSLLTSIGKLVFYKCSSITTIQLPSSLTSIGNNSFYGCNKLFFLEVPKSTNIDTTAFNGCRTLNCVNNLNKLKGRFDYLPLHRLCHQSSVTLEELKDHFDENSNNNNNKDERVDGWGCTALHVLAGNPTTTPDMLEFVSTKCATIVGRLDNHGRTYHYYSNTPQDLSHRNANGGVHDSPQGEPDRLGYNIYAAGISEVVSEIETPDNSLCVALFSPWGTGKTFLYNLIEDQLKLRAKQEEKKRRQDLDKELDEKKTSFHQDSINNSLNALISLVSMLCRGFPCCCCCYPSNETDVETAAVLIAIFCPIWMVIFIVVYFLCLLFIVPVQRVLCVKKKDEDNLTPDLEEGKKSEDEKDVSWEGIWAVLTGTKSAHSNKLFDERGCVGKIQLLFLMVVVTFTTFVSGLWAKIPFTTRSTDKYKKVSNRYIFISINAWVYSSNNDSLWAAFMEQMWSEIENEFGPYQVRLHRAMVAISGESDTDDIKTKLSKRETAKMMLVVKVVTSFMIAAFTGVYLFFFQKDSIKVFWGKILVWVVTAMPFVLVLIKIAKKVLPFFLKSEGAKIAKDFIKLDKHQRMDFSKKTGFMGDVRKEVGYLFDFLRTTEFKNHSLKIKADYRLSVMFDDLDRCDKGTVMEVLQLVIVFLVDVGVTCWLLIDSRLVVECINEYFGEIFLRAGVDGYKYLEKIVQLVFCIPDLNNECRINFLKKMLEKKELDPIRIFKRGKFLTDNEIPFFKDYYKLFTDTKKDPTEKEAIEVLTKVLDLMISNNELEEDVDNKSMNDPKAVNKYIKDGGLKTNDKKGLQLKEEFLHYTSVGIERILKQNDKPRLTENDDDRATVEVDFELDNDGSESEDNLSANNAAAIEREKKEPKEESDYLRGYQKLYQPMMDKSEMASIEKYAEHLGEPRKMKRILNSFMLSRIIAKKLKPRGKMDSVFSEKLLKLIILCEQWPYRMAWLFVVVDNSSKEITIKQKTLYGESISSIMTGISEDSEKNVGESGDGIYPPLINIYCHIVKVLIHSPDDAKIQLQRDGDPYLFEKLLSEGKEGKAGSELKIKDVSAFSDKEFTLNALRPFIFNIQRHMTEKAQVQIDNCILHFNSEDKTLEYEMKSEKFCRNNEKKSEKACNNCSSSTGGAPTTPSSGSGK